MSLITPNSFIHTTGTTSSNVNDNSTPTTIFFITGNPGLIAYYHTFLSLLSSKLASFSSVSSESPGQYEYGRFQVYGHSLAGFELPESESETAQQQQNQPETGCYNLEEQICFVQRRLDEFIANNGNSNNNGKHKVILIGHSVGSYIAMEVLRGHRERQKTKTTTTTTTSRVAEGVEFDIIGGVMLFPTVVDIAKSPAGERLTKLLNLIPHLALIASFFARLLTTLVPGVLLRSLVAAFMGLSPSSSSSENTVAETTCAFLKSRCGVRQALHLGADEMQTITSDKWSDDIWGMSDVQEPLAKLFFYFGRGDHWVAERTRDEIIAVRGRQSSSSKGEGGGPTMLVCEDGLPHAFCLRNNEVMARKTADMIRAIVEGQKD